MLNDLQATSFEAIAEAVLIWCLDDDVEVMAVRGENSPGS